MASVTLMLGCAGPRGELRGRAPEGAVVTVAALREMKPGSTVTVHGKMAEKCPVAGCWFVLQDGTGRVHVDLKAAGFVVTDLPLGREVTVGGRLRRESGTEAAAAPEVLATGARFE
jgi:uncharacterized protein YdeI (BOF family)